MPKMVETIEFLSTKTDEAIKATYNQLAEMVSDDALNKIEVLMRLCRDKGIYEEVEDQRIFHKLLNEDTEEIQDEI